jgi:hypothetical protein
MKHKFLISTAILAAAAILSPAKAGTGQNSAQTIHSQEGIQLAQEKGMGPGGGPSKGETTEPKKGAPEKGMHKGGAEEKGMHKGEMEKRAPERGGVEKKGMEKGEKAEPRDKRDMKSEKDREDRRGEMREERDRDRMTRDRDREKGGTAEKGDRERGSDRTTGSTGGGGKSVQLNSSQQTRIKTVIKEQKSVTRISRTDVHFSVNVGTRVPSSVHLVVLPPTIVEIVPEYRGYYYVVIEDDLLIIDPDTREIVAVIRLA